MTNFSLYGYKEKLIPVRGEGVCAMETVIAPERKSLTVVINKVNK